MLILDWMDSSETLSLQQVNLINCILCCSDIVVEGGWFGGIVCEHRMAWQSLDSQEHCWIPIHEQGWSQGGTM